MCEYVSFCVDKKGNLFFGADLASHEGIEVGHGKKPDTLREAEWTGETAESLSVRVHEDSGHHDENWYRALILARYPTRSALLAGDIVGRGPDGSRAYYRDGRRHREDGPAIEYPDGRREYWRDGRLHREDGN